MVIYSMILFASSCLMISANSESLAVVIVLNTSINNISVDELGIILGLCGAGFYFAELKNAFKKIFAF